MDDREFRALLAQFGVHEVDAGSVLASGPDELRRGWKTALDRAGRRGLDPTMTTWVQGRLGRLATEDATDATRALAAETEAALRLSWVGTVVPVPEGKQPTCDFRVGGLNIEVYCPQQHVEERRVVQADLAAQLATADGPVKVAITLSHPTTGSGRKVTEDGRVVRDAQNRASIFPVNKLIDRVLSAKRTATQFPEGQPNVLWLDLKHGLGLGAVSCLPLRSIIAKGTCFVGMDGVWQTFYGGAGDPLFSERTPLEYSLRPGTYVQQRAGWFRDVRQVSSAMVSVLDGLVRFDNPWAAVPLGGAASALVMTLSDLRPEFSWFDEALQTLETRIEAERERIAWMARLGLDP
jgi:hypothetical protein